MELVSSTRGDAQVTQAVDQHGQPWLVAMAKATYVIDAAQIAAPRLATEQNKLLFADVFEGQPGLSVPLAESDFVPFKAACDVVLKGSAHVPWNAGQPGLSPFQDVGLRVTDAHGRPLIQKSLRVFGARQWRAVGNRWRLSDAESFSVQSVSYAMAHGGAFSHQAIGSSDPREHCRHPMNLVGRGFGSGAFLKLIDGAPAHQTELWADGAVATVGRPDAASTPAAFGPLSRNWQPRLVWAGTYDDAWRDEVFPLLPADFDERFYQCAPPDQQMPYPTGGETVTLAHLTRASAQEPKRTGGMLRFTLPGRVMPMAMLTRERQTVPMAAAMDTVLIDADAMTFDVVWRARTPLKRSLQEVQLVAIGPVTPAWWAGRVYGDAGCAGCGDPGLGAVHANATELASA